MVLSLLRVGIDGLAGGVLVFDVVWCLRWGVGNGVSG